MSMAFEVGKRVVAESESITVDPGQVSLRRCCEAIPRLATGSAGTTATRACTRPRAAPFEPNNGRRSRSERQPENAEQPEPAIDRTRPGDEPPLPSAAVTSGCSEQVSEGRDWPLVAAAWWRRGSPSSGGPDTWLLSAACAWTRVGGLVASIAMHERRARRPGQSRLRLLGSRTGSVIGAALMVGRRPRWRSRGPPIRGDKSEQNSCGSGTRSS